MNRFLISFLLIFFIHSTAQSQGINWIWANGSGWNNSEFSNASTVDALGNVYQTGKFSSAAITFGSITLYNNGLPGSSCYFVVKYDNNGNATWAETADTSNVAGTGISVDVNGNIYVCGYFNSPTVTFGNITLTNTGNRDIFIVKYDSSGTALWARSSTGPDIENSTGIAADLQGNCYVIGFVNNYCAFDSIEVITAGNNDFFIAKYDSTGKILWLKHGGGGGSEQLNAVAVDSMGNAYAAGSFDSQFFTIAIFTLTSSGYVDGFTIKFDHAAGHIMWVKTLNGFGQDIMTTVSVKNNNVVDVAGIFNMFNSSFDGIPLINNGGQDMMLARMETNMGSVIWAKRSGSAANEAVTRIVEDVNGGVILAGTYSGAVWVVGNDTLINAGISDCFAAKFDSFGNAVSAISFGGTGVDYCTGMDKDAADNIYVTGNYEGPAITLGTFTLTNSGFSDLYVAKFEVITSDIKPLDDTDAVTVFPNPSNGEVNIRCNAPVDEIKIYNSFGLLVYNTENPSTTFHLNIPDGIYFLQIRKSESTVTKKIIIAK